MFVKLMGSINMADSEPNKAFQFIEVLSCELVRGEQYTDHEGNSLCWHLHCIMPGTTGAVASIFRVTGNVYFLNSDGKTIDSFWPSDHKFA